MTMPKTIDELAGLAGSLTRLAEIAGVNYSTVATSWKRKGRVPAERAQAVSDGLGVPLHEIRPDLWREPPAGEVA
jgi:DNA-binding transcriptional regulator YdaS (Cro superfamily)